jgi:CRP-like cAMP-binding protein
MNAEHLSQEAIARRIQNISFMLGFSEALQHRLILSFRAVGQIEHLQKGSRLFAEGERASNHGYILLEGRLTVTRADGFETLVEAPELLGEMKQFQLEGSDERTANVHAVEDSVALRFNWDRLYAALGEHLSPAEVEQFRKAIQTHAWFHFLEIEDEI